MHANTCVLIHICSDVERVGLCEGVVSDACLHTCVCVCVYTYVLIHICVCVYTYVLIHIGVCVYMNIH